MIKISEVFTWDSQTFCWKEVNYINRVIKRWIVWIDRKWFSLLCTVSEWGRIAAEKWGWIRGGEWRWITVAGWEWIIAQEWGRLTTYSRMRVDHRIRVKVDYCITAAPVCALPQQSKLGLLSVAKSETEDYWERLCVCELLDQSMCVDYWSEVGMDYDGNLDMNYKRQNESNPFKENEGKYWRSED